MVSSNGGTGGTGTYTGSGAGNHFLGYKAGNSNTTGRFNNFLGHTAGRSNTTGSSNNFLGSGTGIWNTTGHGNNFLGNLVGYANTTGSHNNFVGYDAGSSNTTGGSNLAIGTDAGKYINSGYLNETTSNSIFLGQNTRAKSSGDTNEIVIGKDALGNGSNTVTIGNYSITDNYFNGRVRGSSFVNTSDKKLKKNISTINNPLEKIEQLRGVDFNWKKNNKKSIGFIAQEVEKILPELVSGKETKGVNYANLTALLVEGIKEMRRENNLLVESIEELKKKNKKQIKELRERINNLENK